MEIKDLVRERILGNIKIGTKNDKGLPQKLSYFNVEEDKETSLNAVNIFKKLYPDNPETLKIRFTSEDPFDFKYKRFTTSGKLICIGNDTKAITIGKDNKGRTKPVEIECNEKCQERANKKCKVRGSLKFKLDGIEAGGTWQLRTSGEKSLSNIASEIVKLKKEGKSIVNVPFELSLKEENSLAYGRYYSVKLERADIKPVLTVENQKQQLLNEAKNDNRTNIKEVKEIKANNIAKDSKEDEKASLLNYYAIVEFKKAQIKNMEFDVIVLENINGNKIEYVLHPKADKSILKLKQLSQIKITSSMKEENKNVLCEYEIEKNIENEELEQIKKAV